MTKTMQTNHHELARVEIDLIGDEAAMCADDVDENV
jgi:hypothetical protein